MWKRIVLTLLGLLVVVGGLAGVKALQIRAMIQSGAKFAPPPEMVTVSQAGADAWETTMTAMGSLAAVQGVTVATELPGRVVAIAFTPDTTVRSGDLLVQLDTSSEEAELRAIETTVALAGTNFERFKALLAQESISQAEFDNAKAKYEQATAQSDNIRTIIAKKAIRAPFAGHLGLRLVNLGQILKEGEAIVSLQALDPMFVNFLLPQQQLGQLQPGKTVRVTTDALPGEELQGVITAIHTEIDPATRNVRLQATLANPLHKLRPGMFANVTVLQPEPERVLVIPATAVLYAPYGDSVFVIEEKKNDKTGQQELAVRQQFVRLGKKRGDFTAVISGLKEGDQVVSTGVFKLRNGQAVVIDNSLNPEFKLSPTPQNS